MDKKMKATIDCISKLQYELNELKSSINKHVSSVARRYLSAMADSKMSDLGTAIPRNPIIDESMWEVDLSETYINLEVFISDIHINDYETFQIPLVYFFDEDKLVKFENYCIDRMLSEKAKRQERQIDHERTEYERLKAKFEKENNI